MSGVLTEVILFALFFSFPSLVWCTNKLESEKMPKRVGEEEEEYIKRKIRRLEKKLHKTPDSPKTSSPTETVAEPTETTVEKDLEIVEDELPEDYILALGPEGKEEKELGEEIRPELAARWSSIMSKGLGKDALDLISKKYATPTNFPSAEAPKINPEIMASLSEVSVKRDKRITHRQNLTGKVMCALGKTLTNVFKGDINTKLIVEQINDAAKLCAEIFYSDSASRRFFALAGANQIVKEAVRDSKPDELLFGKDCGEKIKAAQALKKTGSLIKAPDSTVPKTTPKQPKKQGNWRGPSLQHQRSRGGHRQPPARRYPQQPPRDHRRNQHRTRPSHRR